MRWGVTGGERAQVGQGSRRPVDADSLKAGETG